MENFEKDLFDVEVKDSEYKNAVESDTNIKKELDDFKSTLW